MVTYTIPCVHQGEFAEARIAFPSDWVPQLAASGEERMSTILSEEKEWADEANARRAHARMIANALAVLSVVAAVAFTGTIVMLKLRKRKPKPLFQDEYFRDVPSADHPAVLSALMSWNEVPDQAYIATLMKLTDDRVIKLEQATVTKAKKGLLGREKEEQTYRVTVSDAGWKSAKGIDHMVLKVFFAGTKPDENARSTSCSTTSSSTLHPWATSSRTIRTPLRASWPIASTLPQTALLQWCFAWFLVS